MVLLPNLVDTATPSSRTRGPCERAFCSIRFPKRAFFARLFLQISVVNQVGGVVRFKTVDVTILMLMFDFAAGDFFGEFVEVSLLLLKSFSN